MTPLSTPSQYSVEQELRSATIVIEPGQQVDVILLNTTPAAEQITKTFVLQRNSIVRLFTAVFDTANLTVVGQLNGDQSVFEHHLLYFGSDKQTMNFHLLAMHNGRHTMSRTLVRGVVVDSAHVAVAGNIIIAPSGTDTDAHLGHEGLLLSRRGRIDSLPGLEIGTDAVKATHSSAVHYIRPEQLFYLQTRGLAEVAAKQMIVAGFLEETIDWVSDKALRQDLSTRLAAKQQFIGGHD